MRGVEAAGKSGKKLVSVLEKYKFVLLILMVGILLLLLPALSGGETAAKTVNPEVPALSFDLEGLENKIASTLSRMAGAGRVSVVLTVKAGPRQILAQDITMSEKDGANEKTTSTVVASRGSDGAAAVPLQQVYPTFQGALVVCPGGDDPKICLKMMEAVSALTGLGADKISICEGN